MDWKEQLKAFVEAVTQLPPMPRTPEETKALIDRLNNPVQLPPMPRTPEETKALIDRLNNPVIDAEQMAQILAEIQGDK